MFHEIKVSWKDSWLIEDYRFETEDGMVWKWEERVLYFFLTHSSFLHDLHGFTTTINPHFC
jgi:hypothetical protein